LRIIGDSQQLYQLFVDNPTLLILLYQNMDGVSKVEEVTEKNCQLLADLILVLCSSHTYQGVKSSGAVYRIGRDYKVYSRIYPLDSQVKDRFFLQQMQRKQDRKLERYPDDIPRLSPGKEVATSYFIESDSGNYRGRRCLERRDAWTASLLKMVLEKNIANFTKSSLQIIDDGYGVYQASLSIIKIRDATRLQQQGVLFVKGEMAVGKTTKTGIVVLYKGEIIASGEARVVRKSLEEVWKAKGAKLIDALEGRLILKKIDEAIARSGIIVCVPKNALNIFESERRIRQIIYALKNKHSSRLFNPNKVALQDLGIKLPKSKNGLSVDFEGTPYLYPITANQKNIVKIKMTGSRRLDDKLAFELSGIKRNKEFTWHHLDDYNVMDGVCTVQYVNKDIHAATYPHFGSVKLIEDFLNIIYKN